MQLIDNASGWHKLWSVRVALAGSVLNAMVIGWTVFQGSVNPLLYAAINMGLGVCVAVVRVLPQGKPDDSAQ
jgi:hypothetical protein